MTGDYCFILLWLALADLGRICAKILWSS